jgi:hypothetical protein
VAQPLEDRRAHDLTSRREPLVLMQEALERVKVTAGRLKVFPLPSAVLLPGGALPLHIFEPRYRALIADALASDRVFALAQVQPGYERELQGEPPLEQLLGVGVITLHEPDDDGRSNVVVLGVTRARVLRELPRTHLYREVEVELVPDEDFSGPEELELQDALLELMARVPNDVGQRIAQVTTRAKGGALADVVAATIMQDPDSRLEILETADVCLRLQLVTASLLNVVGRITPAKPEGLLN